MAGPDIFAIMDLEWTSWEGANKRQWSGPGEEMEIVQIGALKVKDDETLTETDTLDVLVTPRINPGLSDYFIQLTGITQERLDADGIGFPDALEVLQSFLGGNIAKVYSMGSDFRVIERNCDLNGVEFPFDEAMFVNARELLKPIVGEAVATSDSSQLPAAMGFAPPGAAHQGLGDCRCIAETLRILRHRGKF